MVRRTHLYTGLILLPWVILFGFSGMLFNHPGFGPEESLGSWSPDETSAAGFVTLDPDGLADALVAALDRPESTLRRIEGEGAFLEGAFVFQGQTPKGPLTVSLDPAEGDAHAVRNPSPQGSPAPAFLSGERPPLPEELRVETLGSVASNLLAQEGVAMSGDLTPAPRGGAELRFRVESPETGQRWNLSWNLQQGTLSAREAGKGGPDLYTALTRFHKTHHYPEQRGARWLWTLIADATGLTMVFWGLSGAIMWWQLKPTRLLGIAGLSVAAVLALVVFTGTYRNLHWVPREARPPASSAAPPKGSTPSRASRPVDSGPAASDTVQSPASR